MEKTKLQEALESYGLETRSYSGRCMYGKTCLAITTEQTENPISIIVDVIKDSFSLYDFDCEKDREEFTELLMEIKKCRTDSMGLGEVIYWPNIPYVQEEEEEE